MTQLDPTWIRVSSILSMIPSLSNDKWTYPLQQINPHVLERKAELGTSVHAAISAHIKEEFFVLDDKHQGYLDSYHKWEKEVDLICHQTERRFFYEPMKLTGCIDMIAKLYKNGIFHLIDFKCSASPDPIKWPIQAAFYEFLARMEGISLDKRCFFVQLDPYGDFPKVHEYEITKELSATAFSFYNAYMYLTKK